jgi:membrane-associated phospholipid phosphatase
MSERRVLASRNLALGLGKGAAVAGGLAVLMEFVDRPVARRFEAHTGAVFHLANLLTGFGEAVWWLAPSLAVFLAARFIWRNPVSAAGGLFVFMSVTVSGILVDVFKCILGRARPGLWFSKGIYGFSYFKFSSAYQSFPSGHAACAAGACAALSLVLPRYRIVWIPMGLVIGFTRVVVTAHYVSDVVAATLFSSVVVLAIRHAFLHYGLVVGDALRPDNVRADSLLAAKIVGSGSTATNAVGPAQLLVHTDQ